MTDYYVSQVDGDDSYNGLYPTFQGGSDGPWLTISKVNGEAYIGGDTISFNRDGDWRETLVLPDSGSSVNQIVFGAYGTGADPIINGADLIVNWSDASPPDNSWSATCAIEPYDVAFDGTIGTEESAEANLDAEFEWFWESSVLYVYSTSNPGTAYTSPGIEAFVRNTCINADGKNYITIQDIELKYSRIANIYMEGDSATSTGIILDNITSHHASPNGNANHSVFPSGAEFDGVDNLTVKNSSFYNCGWNGLVIKNQVGSAHIATIVVEDCQAYDNIHQGIDFKAGAGSGGNISGVIIRYNDCYDNGDNGFYMQSGSTGTLSDIDIYYNLFHGNVGDGAYIYYNNQSYASNVDVYNNVFTGNGTTGAGRGLHLDVTGSNIKNNIIFENQVNGSSERELEVNDDGGTPNVSNYNLIYHSSHTTIIRWDTVYWNYSQFTGAGHEANGLNEDPKFKDSEYRLESTSPCIDVGDDVGLSQDYFGNPVPYNSIPDIGAYELLPVAFAGVIEGISSILGDIKKGIELWWDFDNNRWVESSLVSKILDGNGAWQKAEFDFDVYSSGVPHHLYLTIDSAISSLIYYDDVSIDKANITGKLKGTFKFVGTTVGGISSLIADITAILGTGVKAFIGSIGAISGVADASLKRLRKFVGVSIDAVSGIADVPFKRIREYVGTIGGVSGIADVSLKRLREFVGVSIDAVSGIADVPFKRIREFVSVAVGGISGVLGDITVIAGGVIKALAGTIGAISGIADVPLKRIREYVGSVGGVSGVADAVLKRLREFVGVSIDAVSNIVDAPLKRLRKFIGEIISPDLLTDGGLNIWTSATDLTNWIEQIGGSSTINRESVEKVEGAYSCRFDVVDGESCQAYQTNVILVPGASYRIRFQAKSSPADDVGIMLRSSGNEVSLEDDGSGGVEWISGIGGIVDRTLTTGWLTYEIDFYAHPDYSNYIFFFRERTAGNVTYYWDDFSIRKANSQISGVFKALKKFVGVTVEGISSVTGVFTTLGTVLFQGLVEGFSGVTGAIKGTFAFSGSAGETSGVDATLKRLREFVGVSIDAVSNIADASLKRIRKFIVTVGSFSGVDAVLKRIRRFTAPVITGISNIIAPLTKGAEVILQGVVGAISNIDANILVDYVLSGVTGAVSGVDAVLGRVRTFIGTIGSLSGVDAVLGRVRKFVGETVQGISSVLGNIQKGAIKAFIGTIGVISSIADAPLKRLREFAGNIGSISGVSGALSVIYKFIGETVQGVSSVLGELSKLGTVVLQGLVEGFSGVTGSLKTTKVFIGSIGSLSAVDGIFKAAKKFVGIVVSGVSGITGILKRSREFIGEIVSGISSVLGSLKVTKVFIAIPVAAVSNITTVMTTLGTVILRGTIGVISAVDGVLKATFSLKGDAEGLSGVTGLMKYTASFSGLVEVISGLTGTITTAATVLFDGVVGVISGVVGDIKRSRGFTATISSLSGVDVVMKRIRAYIASVNIFSGVNSILKRLRRLSGSILSTTAVDGHVKILYRFIGSIASASIITATIGRVKKFVGVTISVVSSVAGNLWAGVLYIFPIIFTVVPRVKAFLIEARDRIFKSNINKDR